MESWLYEEYTVPAWFLILLCAIVSALVLVPAQRACAAEVLLFHEPFEDTNWESRGWYDGPKMQITASEHIPASGHACVWHWQMAGDISPVGKGARVKLPPVPNVTLSFYIKHSENWKWTGVDWHPHELHFVTTEDPEFVGPAYTHLTFYVEVVNGVPRVAIQDGKNIDNSRIGQNLVGVTENRSVAGGNGDSDGHGEGHYYKSGDVYRNGKHWEPQPEKVYFGDAPGPRYKADWHHIKVKLQLNSIANGVAVKDGIVQYWFDGALIIDHHDVVFRTGRHPDMKINQFLMLPYYGPGVPHEQKIWIDDLKIHTDDGAPDGDPQGSDFNRDGAVDFADFIQFARNFGKRQGDPDFDAKYDLNGSGSVDFSDFIRFAQAFGKSAGGAIA